MTTKALHRLVLAATTATVLAGCIVGDVPIGKDGQPLLFDPPTTPGGDPACAAFCQAASARGCPPSGDCIALCAAERAHAPSCGAELDAVLACAGELLAQDDCSLSLDRLDPAPETPEEHDAAMEDPAGCWWAAHDHGSCVVGEPEGTLQRLRALCDPPGFGALEGEEGDILSTEMTCTTGFMSAVTIRTVCHAGGACACLVDDEVAHECQNLMHSLDMTMPGTGCCGRFFEDELLSP